MSRALTDQQQSTFDEFYNLVNMQPKELEEWLKTDESKAVGDSDDGESTGHQSGRKIVEIKRTNKSDLSSEQLDHMSKVCGYIKRHLAQRPNGDVSGTNWCYSLKNWGHDPTKE
ncbi:MAG: DUF3140 domain-containing protein [Pirellulaceae bacterium]|nr:DUF3140 domain-containing protein [Pirellulaceae bacterium]